MHQSATGQDGQMQLEVDLQPEATYILSKDWQEYEVKTELTKGYHILGIRYTKDVGDALINWIELIENRPQVHCR